MPLSFERDLVAQKSIGRKYPEGVGFPHTFTIAFVRIQQPQRYLLSTLIIFYIVFSGLIIFYIVENNTVGCIPPYSGLLTSLYTLCTIRRLSNIFVKYLEFDGLGTCRKQVYWKYSTRIGTA